MNKLNKKIEELEKGCRRVVSVEYFCGSKDSRDNIIFCVPCKAKLQAFQEAKVLFEEMIDEVMKKARETTLFVGIGHWTEESDIEAVHDGINKIEEELKQNLKGEKC